MLIFFVRSYPRKQFDKFALVVLLGLQMRLVKKLEVDVAEISVNLLYFFFVGRNQPFVITVDDSEKVTVIFADFQNVAKIKTKPQFFGNFFQIVFRNRNNSVCQMKITGRLIITIVYNQCVGCPRIAVLIALAFLSTCIDRFS